MQLTEKVILNGSIILKTGLHIGGAKTAMDIGGLDAPVIKTPNGTPYIPGSSLKGKLRSLLAKDKNGAVNEHEDELVIKKLFGYAGNNKVGEKQDPVITRMVVRDAYLDEHCFNTEFEGAILETSYTEGKYENTIDRKSGTSNNMRQLERVPAGAKFHFEFVLDVYAEDDKQEMLNLIKRGIDLLQKDYLGGNGTRGYGQVEINWNSECQKELV